MSTSRELSQLERTRVVLHLMGSLRVSLVDLLAATVVDEELGCRVDALGPEGLLECPPVEGEVVRECVNDAHHLSDWLDGFNDGLLGEMVECLNEYGTGLPGFEVPQE